MTAKLMTFQPGLGEGPEAEVARLALLIVPYLCPREGFPNGEKKSRADLRGRRRQIQATSPAITNIRLLSTCVCTSRHKTAERPEPLD
jgi:hypothetical protein